MTGKDLLIKAFKNIPIDYVRDVCHNYRISIGGNLQLTLVLLMGSPEDCQRHAIEVMDTAGSLGFILAPGCDLPMNTPPDNLKAITQLVHDPYQQDVTRALDRTPEQQKLLNLGDYGKTDKLIYPPSCILSKRIIQCRLTWAR